MNAQKSRKDCDHLLYNVIVGIVKTGFVAVQVYSQTQIHKG